MPILFRTGMLGAAYGALRPKVLLKHFFQCTTGLNKQAAICSGDHCSLTFIMVRPGR